MKKYIILFFFSNLNPPFFSLPLTVEEEYLLHKRKEKQSRAQWEEEVIIERERETLSFTCW